MNAKIEQSGGSVYAIHTRDGPAVFPMLEDLADAVRAGEITPTDGDREYYAGHDWLPVRAEYLKLVGLVEDDPENEVE